MKAKAKTLIEKHGFTDPDRRYASHDEIQLWSYDNAGEILKCFSVEPKTIEITYKKLEHPIMQVERNYSAVVGFVDLVIWGNVYNGDNRLKDFIASIEIKSSIQSCGDLIRQINFYRRYEIHPSTWIVVSPDDRFKRILNAQGVYFFKYKTPGQLF